MTTTHTNLALVEGEVLILNSDNENIETGVTYFNHSNSVIGCYGTMGDLGNWFERKNYSKIIASTLKIKNTPQLDRKHFVKPKVESNPYFKNDQRYEAWKAGHNAKEAEFTREDMEKAFRSGIDSVVIPGRTEKLFDEFINELHPLSLPASVTLNENNEIIAVQWT